MITRFFSSLFVLVVFVSIGFAETPLKVFILAGQSNMVGQGQSREVPAELLKNDKVLAFVNGEGREFTPEFDSKLRKQKWHYDLTKANWMPYDVKTGHIGPDVGFIQEYAKSGKEESFGIIKFAVNATSLDAHWLNKGHHKFGLLSQMLVETVQAAQKQKPVEIIGMLWMQGESDACGDEAGGKYAENLKTLIEKIRTECKAPEMVFICGRVNPPPAKYPGAEKVREAQMNCSLPDTYWVDCDDLPKRKDDLHYTTEGQLELGKRFARKLLEAKK